MVCDKTGAEASNRIDTIAGRTFLKFMMTSLVNDFYNYTNLISKNGHKIKRLEKLSEVKRQNSDCLSPVFWTSFRILVKRAVVFLSIYFKALIFLVLFVSRQKERNLIKTNALFPNRRSAGNPLSKIEPECLPHGI
jgi:hypothetical protein